MAPALLPELFCVNPGRRDSAHKPCARVSRRLIVQVLRLSKRKKAWLHSTRAIRNWWSRLRLRNRRVTIISNDCWGDRMCKFYHLEFNSPFIGLFVVDPDYVKLLENREWVTRPLEFFDVAESKWIDYLKSVNQTSHPAARLQGTDIEIHFLHYPDQATAEAKWNRRVKRIDWDNAIVKFNQRDVCDDDLIRRFDRLPFPMKVCFTTHPVDGAASAVPLPDYASDPCVRLCWNVSNQSWSFVTHANALLHP